MEKLIQMLKGLCALMIASIALTACSRVTQDNFEKIKPGMTMQEVIAILGEPSSSQSINLAGVSGTTAVWESKDNEITIQLINDRVTIKSYSKSDHDAADNN